jgi:hypothetical protein
MLNFNISSEEFRAKYFELKPHLFPGVGCASHIPPISLESALMASDHVDGKVNVFLNGQIPFDMFTEAYQDVGDVRRRVSLEKVERFLGKGATIAINRIDRNSIHIREICDGVQQFSREVATANCYAATSGSGSFGRHWDTHDVFALQMAGRKRWKVWKPTFYLPVSGQVSRNHTFEEADPYMDVVLEKGDAMYIPRGWWHEALPIEGHTTIHLAIGLHVSTVVDYVSWVAENKLSAEPLLRQSISSLATNAKLLEDAFASIFYMAHSPHNIDEYLDLHEMMLKPARSAFKDTAFFDDPRGISHANSE